MDFMCREGGYKADVQSHRPSSKRPFLVAVPFLNEGELFMAGNDANSQCVRIG